LTIKLLIFPNIKMTKTDLLTFFKETNSVNFWYFYIAYWLFFVVLDNESRIPNLKIPERIPNPEYRIKKIQNESRIPNPESKKFKTNPESRIPNIKNPKRIPNPESESYYHTESESRIRPQYFIFFMDSDSYTES